MQLFIILSPIALLFAISGFLIGKAVGRKQGRAQKRKQILTYKHEPNEPLFVGSKMR